MLNPSQARDVPCAFSSQASYKCSSLYLILHMPFCTKSWQICPGMPNREWPNSLSERQKKNLGQLRFKVKFLSGPVNPQWPKRPMKHLCWGQVSGKFVGQNGPDCQSSWESRHPLVAYLRLLWDTAGSDKSWPEIQRHLIPPPHCLYTLKQLVPCSSACTKRWLTALLCWRTWLNLKPSILLTHSKKGQGRMTPPQILCNRALAT